MRLERSLAEVGRVGVVRAVDHYPDLVELTRLLRAAAPEVMFLGTEAMGRVGDLVKQIEAHAPGVQIIAISRAPDPEVILESMRSGIREFVALPFNHHNLEEAITRVEEQVHKRPPAFQTSDLVYSFLPSKAGVGTSTIALNLSLIHISEPTRPY